MVIDTSALLALLWEETGAERVAQALPNARVSAVNVAELVSKLADRGASDQDAASIVRSLAFETVVFDEDLALLSGRLRMQTKAAGLSIGDRACLTLALRDGLAVMTADRVWADLDIGVSVDLIR